MERKQTTRREFLSQTGIGVSSLFVAQNAFSAEHNQKPNVILIMTDDQGWGDIHSHGNEVIDTPVLDQLAESGARFDRFYVSPVCAPTRASLLTGRYPLRTGVHGVTRTYETMRASEVTLAEVFKRNGYATGCFGKWHNGAHYPEHPNGQGFDEFLGFCAGHWNNYFDSKLDRNGKMIKTEGYITDVFTDAALEFIESNQNQPFFCYLPYNAPHSPWQVPDEYFQKYKDKGLDDVLACAYGMVENIDDNVGRILNRLDEWELSDNTIVIFLTDNGANTDRYDEHMKGRKGSSDEGGVRVPFFIKWPGHIQAGTTVEKISAQIDVLPTLVELCRLDKGRTKPLDGKSLVPLLKGETDEWPNRMLFTYWGGRGAVRTQKWRAVKDRNGNWSLYNMQKDPHQENNIAEQHPNLVKRLSNAYERWYADATKNGFDPIPTKIGYPESPEVVMPGHEAFLHPNKGEGISYYGANGWANDFVTNWTDTSSYPYWEVEVVHQGEYEIAFDYCCAKKNLGAELEVEINGSKIKTKVTKAHNPDFLPTKDLVGRKEAPPREWAAMTVGKTKIQKGRGKLIVRALEIPGEELIDLKAVRVKRLDL